MNRNFTLILSAVLVVILLGIWIYLMFFANHTDESERTITETGEFAEFDSLQGDAVADTSGGSGGQGGEFGSNGDFNQSSEVVLGEFPILRQLTTRNVIGFQEVETASTTYILFMESGVGHVYRIDLQTGEETRISATTIPNARQAVFSHDGQWVAVKTGQDVGVNPIQLGLLDLENKTMVVSEIADAAVQLSITENDFLLYTTLTNSGVVTNVFDVEEKESEVLFTTPFREAIVLFNSTVAGPHYFLPKTSHLLEGFVYEVSGDTLNRLPLDGFGFSSTLVGENILSTYRDQTRLVSSLYDTQTEELVELPTSIIPEKCVGLEEEVYCAQPENKQLRYNSIDRWLQGVESFADSLWAVGEESEPLINITSFSGREVDVFNGLVGKLSGDWYFQNKKDQSLWIYELSRLPKEGVIEENI
jgi:hypothetical protein